MHDHYQNLENSSADYWRAILQYAFTKPAPQLQKGSAPFSKKYHAVQFFSGTPHALPPEWKVNYTCRDIRIPGNAPEFQDINSSLTWFLSDETERFFKDMPVIALYRDEHTHPAIKAAEYHLILSDENYRALALHALEALGNEKLAGEILHCTKDDYHAQLRTPGSPLDRYVQTILKSADLTIDDLLKQANNDEIELHGDTTFLLKAISKMHGEIFMRQMQESQRRPAQGSPVDQDYRPTRKPSQNLDNPETLFWHAMIDYALAEGPEYDDKWANPDTRVLVQDKETGFQIKNLFGYGDISADYRIAIPDFAPWLKDSELPQPMMALLNRHLQKNEVDAKVVGTFRKKNPSAEDVPNGYRLIIDSDELQKLGIITLKKLADPEVGAGLTQCVSEASYKKQLGDPKSRISGIIRRIAQNAGLEQQDLQDLFEWAVHKPDSKTGEPNEFYEFARVMKRLADKQQASHAEKILDEKQSDALRER